MDRVSALSAPRVAERHYLVAIKNATLGDERGRALLGLASAFRRLDQLDESAVVLTAARTHLRGSVDIAELQMRWSLLHRDLEEMGLAVEVAEAAVATAFRAGAPGLVAKAEVVLGNVLIEVPGYRIAENAYRRALGIETRGSDVDAATAASARIGIALALARSGRASKEQLRRAIVDLPSRGVAGVQAQWVRSLADFRLGRIRDAEAGLLDVRDQLATLAMPSYAAAAIVDLAFMYLSIGREDGVALQAAAALDLSRVRGLTRTARSALVLLGHGQVEEAATRLRRFWCRASQRYLRERRDA